jgi:hypothetical protein
MAKQKEDAIQKYESRYCAFVDIMGFRQLINRLSDDGTQFDALRKLLMRVHRPHSEIDHNKSDSDFRAQSISDAVAISTRVTPTGLIEIFETLQALAIDLLIEGYFIRGAIVKAPLYHDNQMVFGRGLTLWPAPGLDDTDLSESGLPLELHRA